uniref:Uncharacterized protein n=1 Tax=Candidatus Kentrum eta TaxID=2126337 RepID=A0A450VDH6_9GAMM|nr:MAG: hypothetical protein BECKH772B_GA0070898_101085 [Candidatus Kentron sp. H]VFJ97301.1 MAG: hypothetical protein BECKH772A_GA0070896_101185 [Candidatus Kentron sp. H]VFK02872.1 MAG: hypothetical protein BECKH772C_GA0070978_101065 [Candidatus Kentron sp. H]
MKTVTLRIEDSIDEKFRHFPPEAVEILEQPEYMSDDEYLRSIPGMVDSIRAARAEPDDRGVSLDKLDW